jgi:hypothetical protein
MKKNKGKQRKLDKGKIPLTVTDERQARPLVREDAPQDCVLQNRQTALSNISRCTELRPFAL